MTKLSDFLIETYKANQNMVVPMLADCKGNPAQIPAVRQYLFDILTNVRQQLAKQMNLPDKPPKYEQLAAHLAVITMASVIGQVAEMRSNPCFISPVDICYTTLSDNLVQWCDLQQNSDDMMPYLMSITMDNFDYKETANVSALLINSIIHSEFKSL